MTRWRLIKALLAVSTVAIVGLGVAVGVAATRDPGSNDNAPPQDDSSEATAWLGILGDTSDDPAGVRIVHVFDDSAADDAGLDRNDVITAIGGDDTASIDELRDAIQAHAPGDEVTLSVIKDGAGDASDVDVTLGEQPGRGLLDIQLADGFGGGILDGLHDLFPDGFDSFLDGSFRYKDDNGDTHEVSAVAGTVTDISDDNITIDTNDGDSQSFSLADDTHVPDGLESGDNVIVVSIDSDLIAVIAHGRILNKVPFHDFHFDFDWSDLCHDSDSSDEDLPSEGDWIPGDFCTHFRGIDFDLAPRFFCDEDGNFFAPNERWEGFRDSACNGILDIDPESICEDGGWLDRLEVDEDDAGYICTLPFSPIDPLGTFCEDGRFPFPPFGLFDEERIREEYCQDASE